MAHSSYDGRRSVFGWAFHQSGVEGGIPLVSGWVSRIVRTPKTQVMTMCWSTLGGYLLLWELISAFFFYSLLCPFYVYTFSIPTYTSLQEPTIFYCLIYFFHILPARETPSHASYHSIGAFSLPDSELVRHVLPHCGMFHTAPGICATSYIIHRHSNGPRDRCEARIWEGARIAVDERQNGKGGSKSRGRN